MALQGRLCVRVNHRPDVGGQQGRIADCQLGAFDRDSIAPTPFALIESEAEDVTREDE
jgi:hypothetical protein